MKGDDVGERGKRKGEEGRRIGEGKGGRGGNDCWRERKVLRKCDSKEVDEL